MPRIEDPTELTPDERLREIAAILATGVLRLRKIRLLRDVQQEPAQESAAAGLEIPAITVLSGRDG